MAARSPEQSIQEFEARIHFVRGQRVMLDSDLARIYGVPTMRLNEQLRRNLKRFPLDFAFQLTRQELANLKSQFAISNLHGGRRSLPWAFSEHGAIMLASVLNSQRAMEMSVFVVRAFVQMREMLAGNRELAAKLDELERRVTGHDHEIAELVEAIRQLIDSPAERKRKEIGFHVREVAPPYRIRAARRF